MDVIPPVNPIFYVFLFLTFLLLVLTLIVLVRSKRARRVKALFFGCACCLQIVTIAYPIYLYSNKPAPLGSPAVLIGQDPNDQIVALNARDGSVIWTQPMANQNASLIGGSGNLFYTVSQMSDGSGMITAYAARNGIQVWRHALPLQQSYGPFEHLLVSSSFIYIDKALGVSDEVVYALRTSDGSIAWKYAEHITDHLGDTTKPLLITAGNGLVFVRAQDSGFSALHASDGSLAWHFSPHISQGDTVFAYQLVLTGQNVSYLQSISGFQDVSLLVLSQGNGKPLWQKHIQGSNAYADGLAGAGAHLYLSINGQTILLSVLNGAQLWQSPLDSGINIAVTEANGIVYIPGNSALNALDERDGKVLWSLSADPDGDFTTPVLSQNVLFASARAIAPHGFFGTGASGQDAVVAINPSNGSVYWSTTNASNFIGIFHLS